MIRLPYTDGTPPGSAGQSNCTNGNCGIPIWEGGDSHPDQGSDPPAWVLSDRLREPRYRLHHWLRDPDTWALLAAAGLTHGRRLRTLIHRVMPGRPPYGPDDPRHVLRYGYSRREIEALAAAALAGEVGR